MLYFLLFVAGLAIGFIYATRRHFNSLTPAYRLEEQHGPLQVRRYAKMAVAEVRVSGGTSLALRSGTFQLDKYFRDEQIARFALPVMCEKVDAADSIWTVSAVLPMPLAAAPPPRNKGIALKELPPHRAVGRLLHGAVTPDDAFAEAESRPAAARQRPVQAARLLEAVDGRRDAPLPVVDARALPRHRPPRPRLRRRPRLSRARARDRMDDYVRTCGPSQSRFSAVSCECMRM